MARVALVKLFTGLNLGVSQLSGELQRAGHDSRIIYFKDFLAVPAEDVPKYLVTDYALTNVAARGKEYVWNCYTPFSPTEYELLIGALRDFNPDLIGFSLTSLPMKPAVEVTQRLKKEFPGVPIIWGGAGPTIEPEFGIEHADLVCVGEGERAILELARRIDAGEHLLDVAGVWARRPDGSVAQNPGGPLIELEEIAIPDFAPERTIHINDDRMEENVYPLVLGKQYVIMTQRGCPFSCNFCIESVYQDMFGKKHSLRRRSVDVVIQELVEAKKNLDVKTVMFYDDVFTVNPTWLKEFATRYKAEVGLPFWCYTYPTTTHKDQLLMLKDAGLQSITMGIQSGSEEILKNFNRPVKQDKAHEAARIIIESGVTGFFDLITKVDFETEEHCRKTFEFLLEFPQEIRSVGFGAMVSFPKFGYTDRVQETGAKSTLTQQDYEYYHKLYFLTRTELPRWAVKRIGESRLFRRFPKLIDAFLPKQLPIFFLGDAATEFSDEIIDTPHAQAVIPGGRLDRGADRYASDQAA